MTSNWTNFRTWWKTNSSWSCFRVSRKSCRKHQGLTTRIGIGLWWLNWLSFYMSLFIKRNPLESKLEDECYSYSFYVVYTWSCVIDNKLISFMYVLIYFRSWNDSIHCKNDESRMKEYRAMFWNTFNLCYFKLNLTRLII